MRGRYLELLSPAIARLLSLIDREPRSATCGCCYPPFWRGDEDPLIPIPNFVNARWQEAGLSLALLYLRDWPGSEYYRRPQTLEWCGAVLRYWAGLRRPDGSFAEWRPNGHEQPPTASSAAALARAFGLLTSYMAGEDKRVCLPAFRAAAEYLVKHPNHVTLHYEAAAVDALHSIHALLPQFNYADQARQKVRRILELQSPHGWLAEQGGPDFGASMSALYHLALYYRESRDEQAAHILGRLLEFMQYFFYPGGACGGGFNSLYAAAAIPTGFALLRDEFPLAAAILPHALQSLLEGAISPPDRLTDQFLALQLHKYLFALDALPEQDPPPGDSAPRIPADSAERIEHEIEDAGISIVKTPNYYAVIGPNGALGALHGYRGNATLMLSSRNQLEAVSGLKVLAREEVLWNSMRRDQEQRERKERWLQAACRVNPVERHDFTHWASASERYPFRFMSDWSRRGIISSRMLQRLKLAYERSFLPLLRVKRRRRELDPDEHFLFTRRLHFQDGAIVVQNLVVQKTRARAFTTTAVCEPLLILHRDEAQYAVELSGATFALANLDHGLNCQTERIVCLKNQLPLLTILFDGPRPVRLRWYRTRTQRDNPLRYLEASCLQLEIDIQAELQANWKARVDYTIHL